MHEKIRNTIVSNKIIKAFILLLLMALFVLYFRVFFSKGIQFENTFLSKKVEESEVHYKGRSTYGNIHIIVSGVKDSDNKVDVIYKLPNNITRQYTVVDQDKLDGNSKGIIIKDSSGAIAFEGIYRKADPFLYDKNWQPFMEEGSFRILMNGESPFREDYHIYLKSTADLANFSTEVIRGKIEFLLPAILIFIVTILDIRFPLFFFHLNYRLAVRDPEPSDLYLTIQKIAWYAGPIIGIIFMLIAIF
jgi:hypothetical protein